MRRETAIRQPGTSDWRITLLICFLLVAIVWVVFCPALGARFLNYDDNDYVYDNSHITNGLTFDGIGWAFTHFHADNWHPLTTISHMLDCQLFGLHPWGHHLTNILLHAATAILLFLALCRLTTPSGAQLSTINHQPSTPALWPSAFVAALFAIHPLRVESVAWISELKDVLSGVFFMLTLWAYAAYVRDHQNRIRNYIFVLVCFGLGLMCKPTLVTLPFVLLLLDYWPLARWQAQESEVTGQRSQVRGPVVRGLVVGSQWSVVSSLVVEKISLFVLSAASCVVTFAAQKSAFSAIEQVPFQTRFSNAIVSYVTYLGQTIWPNHLAALYPYPENRIGAATILLALVLLWIITIVTFVWRKRWPYLLVGWLWFIGMMIPMIGLVQVGSQSRADRYTYLPAMGLYIAVTWGAVEIANKRRAISSILKPVAVVIVGLLAVRSYSQTQYWHDSQALWQHTVDVTGRNHIAQNSLGNALLEKNDLDRAITHYREALAIRPNVAPVESNLGNALLRTGKVEEAITEFQKAIQNDPRYAEAYNDMGSALIKKGELSGAISYYEKAVALNANYADAHNNMAVALAESGQVDHAIGEYRKAIAIKPQSADAQCNLGNALARKNDWPEAIVAYTAALRARPNYAKARNNLGVALEKTGKDDEAFAQFQENVRENPNYAEAHYNFGRLLTRRGRREEAIVHLNEALRLEPNYEAAKEELLRLGVEK